MIFRGTKTEENKNLKGKQVPKSFSKPKRFELGPSLVVIQIFYNFTLLVVTLREHCLTI